MAWPDKASWKEKDLGWLACWGKYGMESDERAGTSFHAEFEGTGILWSGNFSNIAGYADIFIDDKLDATVSQYSEASGMPWMWSRLGLEPGPHTIDVVVNGKKPPESHGYTINVKHLRIIK